MYLRKYHSYLVKVALKQTIKIKKYVYFKSIIFFQMTFNTQQKSN